MPSTIPFTIQLKRHFFKLSSQVKKKLSLWDKTSIVVVMIKYTLSLKYIYKRNEKKLIQLTPSPIFVFWWIKFWSVICNHKIFHWWPRLGEPEKIKNNHEFTGSK